MGNHDYGDYVDWESEAAKRQNMEDLKRVQKEMGFHLLLNESVSLEKEGEKISLVGVENWGKGRFKKAGDLEKASAGIKKEDFIIDNVLSKGSYVVLGFSTPNLLQQVVLIWNDDDVYADQIIERILNSVELITLTEEQK